MKSPELQMIETALAAAWARWHAGEQTPEVCTRIRTLNAQWTQLQNAYGKA